VSRLIADAAYLADISSSSNSSSEEDDEVEAKRQRLDPDYQPSTASESPLTSGSNSQQASENEADEPNTETDDESWRPSDNTSLEVMSSPDDD
jgi:hypothetical protein